MKKTKIPLQIICNNSGVGVIQILLTTGIITSIFLGLGVNNYISFREEKDIEDKYEALYLHNEIIHTLSIPSACLNTFSSMQLQKSISGVKFALKEFSNIYDANKDIVFKTENRDKLNGSSIRISKMKFGHYKKDTAEMIVNNLPLDTANVEITYTKKNKSIGPSEIVRDFKLVVITWKSSDIDMETGKLVSSDKVGKMRLCQVFDPDVYRVKYTLSSCSSSITGSCTPTCPGVLSPMGTTDIVYKQRKSRLTLCGI